MLIDFSLGEQEPCVQGHFPGAPIAPGAWLLAKIDIALRDYLPRRRLKGFSKVKFLAPLHPGMKAQLQMDFSGVDPEVAVEVKLKILCDDRIILDGKAQLD